MAAPSPRFFVLNEYVKDPYNPGPEWSIVACKSKEAYDCGPIGQQVVEGLTLLVRLGDDDHPDLYRQLSVRATDDVFRLVGADVPDEVGETWWMDRRLSGRVCAVDGGVMFMDVCFFADRALMSYYLVYDSGAASLSLIPHPPPHCPTVGTRYPLPVRRENGGGGDYSLVLMAIDWEQRSVLSGLLATLVLFLWSPPPPSRDRIGQWRMKHGQRPKGIPDGFNLDVAFSCKGKAFWADLAQGVLYCNCSDLLNGDGDDPVEFNFIALPEKHRISYFDALQAIHAYRNMGGVGDSIWFVVTESYGVSAGDTKVEVWTLDLTQGQWDRHRELRLSSIWGLDGFRQAGLLTIVPKFPILREQDDGVLYFLLPADAPTGWHILGIDIRSSSEMRLLMSRRLAVPWISRPVVFPPDFFKYLLDPRKGKLSA